MADIIDFNKHKNINQEEYKQDVIETLESLLEEVKQDKIKAIAFAFTKSKDTEQQVISSGWTGLDNTKGHLYSAIKMLNFRYEHDFLSNMILLENEDE